MRPRFIRFIAALAVPWAAATLSAAPNVEVVVNPSLYAGGAISAGLDQYLADIRTQGYNPILTTSAFATPADLRSHLTARRDGQGLAGAVFIGDLPVANFEINAHSVWSYESFPSDLYYQDLDGTWSDADADGLYDGHTGDVAPEIWMGRLLTHELTSLHPGRTEAGMLNEYFARNHAYRYGQLRISEDGLAYVDDDWAGATGESWSFALSLALSGNLTYVSDGATTVASDYKARLGQEWEHVLLCAHSNASYHHFKIGGSWTGGQVYNSDLTDLNPKVLFYNLFACLNADYSASGYMAGEYVFGSDSTLLAVGSTKTGGMLRFGDYFVPLGNGETFGDAWANWWAARAAGGFDTGEKDWHYGMTMIGDPLLVTQQYLPIPEPAAAALLLLAGPALARRRRAAA